MSVPSFRSSLRQVHLWLAIVLSLPMVLIGVSGSALLVQREILAHSLPAAHATGASKTIPEIVSTAQHFAPAGSVAHRINLPQQADDPATVRFSPRRGKTERDIFIDPVSLQLLGSQDVVERGPILAFLIG